MASSQFLSYTDLKNDFLENIGKTGSTDTTLLGFFDRHMGQRYQFFLSKFTNFLTQTTKTMSTVASQQFYHKPAGVIDIETAILTVGNIAVPLQVVGSQLKWDEINKFPNFTSVYPQYIFPRKDDFGIWPTPQAVYTLTLNYHLRSKNLGTDDYTTGTAAVTNNSTTVTITTGTVASSMVGQWFTYNTDGFWYRINGYNLGSNTITLETSFEGTSASGGNYRICDVPELPAETQILLSQGTIADYFALLGDIQKATWWNNVYFTGDGNNNSRDEDMAIGGLLGSINTYIARSNSAIIHHNQSSTSMADKVWATTIVGS